MSELPSKERTRPIGFVAVGKEDRHVYREFARPGECFELHGDLEWMPVYAAVQAVHQPGCMALEERHGQSAGYACTCGAAHEPRAVQLEGNCQECGNWVVLRGTDTEAVALAYHPDPPPASGPPPGADEALILARGVVAALTCAKHGDGGHFCSLCACGLHNAKAFAQQLLQQLEAASRPTKEV